MSDSPEGLSGPPAEEGPSDEAEPSDFPVRTRIVEILEEEPGLHKRGLKNRLAVSPQTLEHHLKKLEEASRILVRDGVAINQTVCFTREQAHLWADERVRPLWGRHRTRHVAVLLVDQAPATSQELGEALGLDASSVRHHLRKLRDHDLVEKEREGHAVGYLPVRRLEVWVEEHRETIQG